jgi:DNA end-binding protein Ku
MLDLAAHIIKTKSGHFNPKKFEDHYEQALKELLRKKDRGEKIEVPPDREPAKVINLMEALRRSAKGDMQLRLTLAVDGPPTIEERH